MRLTISRMLDNENSIRGESGIVFLIFEKLSELEMSLETMIRIEQIGIL